ncbi:hypothetical protein CAAN1_01S10088 [[Candida] anglica]|uniref:Uncharacterized protein n=1 Tax=[Candida] anglica TaxID=148631 RepID=A0ABP0EM80_9ASCO
MSSKRRFQENQPETKKFRNEIEQLQEYSTSEEWPIYNHPEGGIVKITPWGSLRQYTHPITGQMVTKFEDMNFQDHSFNQNAIQTNYAPSTPQSMCPTSSDSPSPAMKLSPGDEVENYVVEGYQQHQHAQAPVPTPATQAQFQQEHENYFGMASEEEDFQDNSAQPNDAMMY